MPTDAVAKKSLCVSVRLLASNGAVVSATDDCSPRVGAENVPGEKTMNRKNMRR